MRYLWNGLAQVGHVACHFPGRTMKHPLDSRKGGVMERSKLIAVAGELDHGGVIIEAQRGRSVLRKFTLHNSQGCFIPTIPVPTVAALGRRFQRTYRTTPSIHVLRDRVYKG